MKLYLCRHGETTFNRAGRSQGWYDAQLTEKGEEQAEKLASFLADRELSRVYSSTLIRAYNTAEKIAATHGLQPTARNDLKEINRGLASGISYDEKQQAYEQLREQDKRPEEWEPSLGESYIDLQERIIPVIEQLIEDNDSDFCIVAHGAVNRVYLAHLQGTPAKYARDLSQDNCCVNIIDTDEREIIACNYTEHLN
jgi:probable phosphoglycerate mutase